MRRVAAAVAILACADTLVAAELTASSKIDSVVVFPSGAEVRRLARVKLEAGEHTILFADLPQQAVEGSIRVEGKATGPLEIGAIDVRRVSVPRIDPEVAASKRKRIENEIERLKDERALHQATQQAAEARKSFLANLVQLPTRTPQAVAAGAAGREDWAQVLGLIAQEMPAAQKAVLEAGVRIRDIDRKIRDLEQQLRAEGPPMLERTEVKVFLAARAPLEADLTVRYQVPEASWGALYDARLWTGSRAAPPKLTLTRRASITQRTAEPWENVTLSLSTSRPAAGAAAPDLKPIIVDFPPERPPTAMPASPPQATARRMAPGGEAGATRDIKEAPAPMEEAIERRAEADVTAFQAVFAIPGRLSVANTGEAKRVQIEEIEMEPALTVRAVPRLDPRAFLYARFTLPKAAPYLAGQVSLFRDRTLVGNGRLPQLSAGEEHELGFGPDDAVRVKHVVVEEKRGESGLISAMRTDTRSYRMTIRSLHERPIAFSVRDQVPVAGNQDIKVELIGRTPPTRRDVDDRRGVLAWEDKLAPDEERVIEFGYRITWPSGKSIVFGR
ncbi:MAG TPA: mucoidy inhibitor MuiA family protein [Hyphomicrobiaceae bacterium]|nr:mucoidy inhibitor MuiA family protein [Hyphomicrobiaceae bacterium]